MLPLPINMVKRGTGVVYMLHVAAQELDKSALKVAAPSGPAHMHNSLLELHKHKRCPPPRLSFTLSLRLWTCFYPPSTRGNICGQLAVHHLPGDCS